MPRDIRHTLYVGIYNSVVALDARDGAELWRSKLGGYTYVNVHWDGEQLFAATKGEVFCLDPNTGAVVWNAKLKGLSTGSVTLASTRGHSTTSGQEVAAEYRHRQRKGAASST